MAADSWKHVMIKVIFRKGDASLPENYRPICTPSTVYKVFSTLLYNRLYSDLDKFNPPDQGGFRRSLQTTDRLMTYRMLEQKSGEWEIHLWVATIDFAKAFDTLHQDAIWKSLSRFRTREPFHLSSEEFIFEPVGGGSDRRRERRISDCKGVKARRPAELFAVQLGASTRVGGRLAELEREWDGYKMRKDRRHCISNLLLSPSLNQLKKMMNRLQEVYQKSGTGNSPRQDENSHQPRRTNKGEHRSTTSSWIYYSQTRKQSTWDKPSRSSSKRA